MAYTDRYAEYLDKVPEWIKHAQKKDNTPVFGHTSNLDVVLHWDVDSYNRILDQYLKVEPAAKEGDTIDSMEDFARISSFYIRSGLGGNFDITTLEVCDYLRNTFTSEFALGGTAAQGAAAIGTLGFPVSIHLTDDCKEVCEMLDHPGTTVIKDGQKVPVMEAASDSAPVYHFIFQFNKGDRIRILGEEVVVPLSNRLILFFDTIHKKVPLREDFLTYWETCDEKPSSCLLSGFDAIIDEKIMAQNLDRLEKFLFRLRERSPKTMVYFEGAFYMNSAVKDMIFERLSKHVDIIGMNEEELEAQLKRLGECSDISDLLEILTGLDIILERFTAGGIILHTKDYSLYYGREIEGVDIEAGLTLGNTMSGTRARIGKYGTLEECRETLAAADLSERGLDIAEQAEDIMTQRYLKIVPSRLLEHPKYTIGLGDTFVSGVHTCFIKQTV